MTNVSRGSLPSSIALACSSTFAGESVSQLRASTKKRTIALRAAVSTPLPATSPTSTATASPFTGQAPYTSPPVGSFAAGAYSRPVSYPGTSGSDSGTKPSVSARAMRRSRS